MEPQSPPLPGAIRAWRRLPLAVRSVVAGVFVFFVMQAGWVAALLVNREALPEVPWSVPVGLLYLWITFRYFNGRGWPASTAESRRRAMRARRLSREEWKWSLLYCLVSLVFMASIINVVYRFIPVPEAAPMDLSMFPWWTLYPSLIMLSINAGVSEECGFRGYMQGELERRWGPAAAIVLTSVVFWLAHFNHPNGPARVVLLVGYGPPWERSPGPSSPSGRRSSLMPSSTRSPSRRWPPISGRTGS